METLSLALLIVCVYSLIDLYKKCSSNPELSITENIKQNAGNLIIIAIKLIIISEKIGFLINLFSFTKFIKFLFFIILFIFSNYIY